MTKLNRLKLEGLSATDFRGHTMSRFANLKSGTRAYSNCERCGKELFIESKPAANDIDISGEAVALGCTDDNV